MHYRPYICILHITFMINACIWYANCNTCTTCFISYRYSVLRYELHTNLYQCDSNRTCVISANHNFVPSQWYIYLFCTRSGASCVLYLYSRPFSWPSTVIFERTLHNLSIALSPSISLAQSAQNLTTVSIGPCFHHHVHLT